MRWCCLAMPCTRPIRRGRAPKDVKIALEQTTGRTVMLEAGDADANSSIRLLETLQRAYPDILSPSEPNRTTMGGHTQERHPQYRSPNNPRFRKCDARLPPNRGATKMEPVPRLRLRQFPDHRPAGFSGSQVNGVFFLFTKRMPALPSPTRSPCQQDRLHQSHYRQLRGRDHERNMPPEQWDRAREQARPRDIAEKHHKR